ncbi:MAG TPA: DUF1428 domain-containing protein [Candidatus Nanoarchaeia archaeon]|nr:DUF1428 domain-containing protein [Candidatus Nanoarchaeia archaeon]
MVYVDGFLFPVPKKNLAAYRKMAKWGAKMWMKHGALDYKECQGDDLKGMPGCVPFPKMVKTKTGETVFFSYIVYKSRAHRDKVNAKVMKEMESIKMPKSMPFDPKRMAYGGFKAIVEG